MPDPDHPPYRPGRSRFDRADETARLWDRPAGDGIYRRRIVVRRHDGHVVTGAMEDDFHHFHVEVTHDGSRVTRVDSRAERGPWTTCADAVEPLRLLAGVELSTSPTVLRERDARSNCTHLFDLAGLAITHAARTRPGADSSAERRHDLRAARRYDLSVDEAAAARPDGSRTATLWVDGALRLRWDFDDDGIVAPAEWTPAPLRAGFLKWAAARLDHETAESAIVLRRGLDISKGRDLDLDEVGVAAELADFTAPVCHSLAPGIADHAVRIRGSARDFTEQPELLLGDLPVADS